MTRQEPAAGPRNCSSEGTDHGTVIDHADELADSKPSRKMLRLRCQDSGISEVECHSCRLDLRNILSF